MRIGNWCFGNSGYAVHYYTDEQGRHQTLYIHREIITRALSKAPSGTQID
jgi:hypothetical protein